MDNKWVKVYWTDLWNSKYNNPFPDVNGLVIRIIEKIATANAQNTP